MTLTTDFHAAFMRQAYLDFLDWAYRKDEFLAQFYEATGKKADGNFDAFRVWVTEAYWGEVE